MRPGVKTTVVGIIALILYLGPPVSAQHGHPPRVELKPNALQRMRDCKLPVMDVEVRGITPGQPVHIEILRDCNADRRPDLKSDTDCCKSPIASWDSEPANDLGQVRAEIDFATRKGTLPENVGLWVRVTRIPNDGLADLAPFGLLQNPCDLWTSLVDTFFGGDCDPGLTRALWPHRGPDDLEAVIFEVRRLKMDPVPGAAELPETLEVPGTLGATGVAWMDNATLIVTRGSSPSEGFSVIGQEKPVAAGLYRIPLGGEPALLWRSEAGDVLPTAPLALPGGRIAFVRQSLAPEPLETVGHDAPTTAILSIWKDGSLEPREVPLPYHIQQLLKADDDGRQILALTLGFRSSRPLFLHIDLRGAEPSVEAVGYDHSLYLAALRAPGGQVSVIAIDDVSGRFGWDLSLIRPGDEIPQHLVHRKGRHDLMPAWRPDGKELAYLAEVSRMEWQLR